MADVRRRKADWSNLRVFFAVAECGGINAAARALRLNPSTVTRTVEELERQLGVVLLTRGPRGVTLTQAGRLAHARVATMEHTVAALELEVAHVETLPEGRVRIAAPDGLATYFIAPALPGFLREHPALDLTIDCGLWPDRPLEGEADLTLTFSEPAHPDAVSRCIAHLHYALFASRGYLAQRDAPRTAADVLQHPYIYHAAQTHQQEVWGERVKAFHTLTQKRVETNSSGAVVRAVCSGAGIAALPTAILSVEPDLVMLDTPPLAPAKLWLTHHRDAGRLLRVRTVADWLAGLFDGEDQPWYRPEFVHPGRFDLEWTGNAGGASAAEDSPERPQACNRGAAKLR